MATGYRTTRTVPRARQRTCGSESRAVFIRSTLVEDQLSYSNLPATAKAAWYVRARRTGSELYAEEVERAAELYRGTVHARQGRIVFVAGSPGSGRTAFLRELATAFDREKPSPLVLAGSLASGSYVPWPADEQPSATREAVAIVKSSLALAAPIGPIVGLASQVVSMSEAAARLVSELYTPGAQTPDDLVPRLLRAAAAERPVVVLVDDSDRGEGSLWFDLVSTFASQVVSDLPLFLLLALAGPARPRSSEVEEPESDSLGVAGELCGRGLAAWWALPPLTRDQIGGWIRPGASDVVVDSLLGVTGGLRSWTDSLWRDWVDRGVVEQREHDAYWQFAPDRPERATDPVSDLLNRRLRLLSDAATAQELFPLYDLLAYGALEGRLFTAEGIALALGRDRDETIDLLDVLMGSDADHPPSILKDEGGVTVGDVARGEGHVWLYEFRSWLDWLTLERHGPRLLGEARSRVAGKLAKALEEIYGTDSKRIAGTLARLLRLAGNESGARRYQRMADYATGAATLRWQARQILTADRTQWRRLQQRRKAYVLLEAARALRRSGPFDEGVEVARGAAELAESAGIGGTPVAEALTCEGYCHNVLGEDPSAEAALRTALKIWRRVRDQRGEAEVRRALAWMDIDRGTYQRAREALTEVLGLMRRLGDLGGQAHTRVMLARIQLEQADYQQAREELTDVVKLMRRLGDRTGAARALILLADIEFKQGNHQPARVALTEALELAQEVGERRGETEARFRLVKIGVSEGNYKRAEEELNELLTFASESGEVRLQAAAWNDLAWIDLAQGNYDRARERLAASLELMHRLQDRGNKTQVRALLGRLDLEEGHHDKARHELNEALGLARALGKRDVEAVIGIDLGRIDTEEGEYAHAREELTQAIETLRALGVRHEETAARRFLAGSTSRSAITRRRAGSSREVVETARALGARPLEAGARRDLARIDAEEGNTARACEELAEVIDTLHVLGARPDEEEARRELAKLECGQR